MSQSFGAEYDQILDTGEFSSSTALGSMTATSPVGNSWYDSLQMKLNMRLSHGISVLATYTWQKSLTRIATFNDWTNFATQEALDVHDIPQTLSINTMYQTPHPTSGLLGSNKLVRAIFSDWQISAVLRYQSGALISAPVSNDNLGTYLAGASAQYMTRVPGQPLYLVDPNGKIDPTQQLLLNPAAWTECGPTATFGCGAPRYSDFRQRRSPQEDIGLGQRFVLARETSKFFEIRVEMYNPFNRIVFPAIGVGNPLTSATHNSNGQLTGGFGFMNVNTIVDSQEYAVGGQNGILKLAATLSRWSFGVSACSWRCERSRSCRDAVIIPPRFRPRRLCRGQGPG